MGNIRLRWLQKVPAEKLLIRNRDVIEEIWQQTRKERGGKLHNDTLLNFVAVDKVRDEIEITGNFVEYKHFLAQRKRPDLNLGIKPIGVSGIIILAEEAPGYVLFAKRTNDTTEYPAFLELVPSGSINKACADSSGIIDYESKLLLEFTEETGLPRDCVKAVSGFAFVLDTNDNVYDVCCKMVIDIKKDLVIQKFRSSIEYQSPIFVAVHELEDFIRLNHDSIVPTSIALAEAFRRAT